MFSAYEENLYPQRYLQAGAKGYFYKQTSNTEIKKALQTVCSGGVYMSDNLKNIMLNKMLNHDDDQNPLDYCLIGSLK